MGNNKKKSTTTVSNVINDAGYTGYNYRLRAGSPIYDMSGTGYLHTFGAEINEIRIYECAAGGQLPSSGSFMGQGGSLFSASFSRIGDRGGHFSGRIVYAPTYHNEGVITTAQAALKNRLLDVDEVTFIECTSLNVSYDVMGLVSISYTVVSNTPGMKVFNVISGPGFSFSGFVTNASSNPVSNSTTWFETHVTLMASGGGGGGTSTGGTPAGGSSDTNTYPPWWQGYKK